MKFIRHEFYSVPYSTEFKIYPLGDIHVGSAECDEAALKSVVEEIDQNPNARWIGLGDYCDFITLHDPRFNAGGLAKWLTIADLSDIAKAQRERFLGIIEPIADKCLCLVEGNHETAIKRHYERDVYLEIVNGVKELAGWDAEHKLALHYNGWLWLDFYPGKTKSKTVAIIFYLHHGYVGGRLEGAKALNMQRELWNTEADIVLMGHSHNTAIYNAAIKTSTRSGKVLGKVRRGAFCGSFLRSYSDSGSSYAEVKGYLPQPLMGVEIGLKPLTKNRRNRIKLSTVER